MPRCPNPRCRADYLPGTTQCTNPSCQCILPGAVVAGRYRVETLIGLGGMGAVYGVNDTFEMQQVALKVIISVAKNNMDMPTAIERFRREARYAHQLHHKNIVPILNFGQDGSLLYLVMPLITGGTLKSLLKAEKPLPVPLAQRYLNDLAEALSAVHAHPQQIVHRDIKPSNLLVHQDDGRLVLADFGIARAMQKEQPLTQRGWGVGTEHYVAPEQEHGKAEPASDIYSMGVVAYQLFTGLLPFQALVRNVGAEVPPPSKLNPEVPSAVDAVIERAMELEPAKRYPSAKEFAEALNAALTSPPITDIPTVLVSTGNANVIVRTVIPENPCGKCGQENRATSRFCRRCGHSLQDTSHLVTDVCQVGYVSDVGRRYAAEENEDMLLIVQGLCVKLTPPPHPFGLFQVPSSDQQASSPSRPLPPPDTILEPWLGNAVRQANQVIYHCNADYEAFMASTLTVALLYKHRLYVASVGDSRAYHYNPAQGLQRITTDHTLAANLVEVNLLQPDEVYNSPKRHRHYRYLGQDSFIAVDLFQRDVAVNDLILLCTDGLWHMVRDEKLTELLVQGQSGDPQKLARTLVDTANLSGGEGNVSAIVIKVQ